MKKKLLLPIVLVFVMFIMSACVFTNWQVKSVTGHEALGIMLEATGVAAEDLCNSGVLSVEECGNLDMQYRIARDNYRIASDMLVNVIDLEDGINRKQYDNIIMTVSSILEHINIIMERN